MHSNTSDASDMVAPCRPAAQGSAEQNAEAGTTSSSSAVCAVSSLLRLPCPRENAGGNGESGREISGGVCLLISRTWRLVFGLQSTGGGDGGVQCKSFAARLKGSSCALCVAASAEAVGRRSLGHFFVCRRCAGFVSAHRTPEPAVAVEKTTCARH